MYEKLGFEPEYFSELEDGTYTLTNDQKRIIQEWKDENIEAELDFCWTNGKGDSPSNRAEEAIREFCKRNELCIADDTDFINSIPGLADSIIAESKRDLSEFSDNLEAGSDKVAPRAKL